MELTGSILDNIKEVSKTKINSKVNSLMENFRFIKTFQRGAALNKS
jgi:hypothetical protein